MATLNRTEIKPKRIRKPGTNARYIERHRERADDGVVVLPCPVPIEKVRDILARNNRLPEIGRADYDVLTPSERKTYREEMGRAFAGLADPLDRLEMAFTRDSEPT